MKKPIRARDLGVPFDGTPGRHNAITDVKGVLVGHATIIRGRGRLRAGKGPVRTGVTAVLPTGRNPRDVFAAWFSLNGAGEMTGTAWIDEAGLLYGPVVITNTHSVGLARDAVAEWLIRRTKKPRHYYLPVAAETCDSLLNDINGFHVKKQHVFKAIQRARAGPVIEGNAGGGTGMAAYQFKGGIGTASRRLSRVNGGYTVGVLVQANYSTRRHLRVAGVPVGKIITGHMPKLKTPKTGRGSIIIVAATDAPLLPHQLKRVVKRAAIGLSLNGTIAESHSGDLFLAFSTAFQQGRDTGRVQKAGMVPLSGIGPIFEAVVQATEEAVINALVRAKTMTGIDGNTIYALPHLELIKALKLHKRL